MTEKRGSLPSSAEVFRQRILAATVTHSAVAHGFRDADGHPICTKCGRRIEDPIHQTRLP